jgi:ribosome-binding factor A
VYTIDEHDPLSASVVSIRHVRLRRDGWDAEVHVSSTMRSDAETFTVDVELTASSDGDTVAHRTWHFCIPRDCV